MNPSLTSVTIVQRRALLVRIAGIGLASGIGAGMALLATARLGFSALLGDLTLYVVMLGAGWFTGRVLDGELLRLGASSPGARDWLILPVGFAVLYTAGVDALDTLLVDVTLTGAWLVPSLGLAIVAALLGGILGLRLRQLFVGTRTAPVVALCGVIVAVLIVGAINLLAWYGARTHAAGAANPLMLVGVWSGYFVPALWLTPVAAFALWPTVRA